MSGRGMIQATAGCLCGDVRIIASGEPYRVGLCHCLDCRKNSGSLFQALAMFPEEAVTVEGETREFAGRHFCARCGSTRAGGSNRATTGISARNCRAAISRALRMMSGSRG